MIEHPHQTPDGRTVTLHLDWTGSEHWGGKPRACRSCSQPTRLLDDQAQPQHKACAEAEATAGTATPAQRTARSSRPSRARRIDEPELEAEALL